MMSTKENLALAALLLVVAGCGDMVRVSDPVQSQQYVVEDFQQANVNQKIRTQVYENSFEISQDRFAAAVFHHMKGANLGRPTTFTPTPGDNGSGAFHVVMIFDPPRGTDPEAVCGRDLRVSSTRAGPGVFLMSAFCWGDKLLSTADGDVGAANGPDDPRFRSLIRQVTLALFPAYDHLDIGGDGGNVQN